MQIWSSPADVASEFGLQQHSSDATDLASALKSRIIGLHPDKTGGDFASDVDKAAFHRTQDAISYLEAHSESLLAMVPISQLPMLFESMARALSVRSEPQVESLRSKFLSDTQDRLSRRSLLPKISSGAFAAITGFLFAFPGQFEGHPIIGPLLETPSSQLVLFSLLLYSALGFAYVWYRERAAESRAEFLVSEYALRGLYDALAARSASEGEGSSRISSRQIIGVLDDLHGRRGNPFSILQPSLELPTLERAAEIQTQRLVERGVLSKLQAQSLESWFELTLQAPGT